METKLLRAKDVADILSISRSQAFSLMRSGALQTVRFGKLVRVRPEDLESFITNNISTSPDEGLKAKLAAATASVENNQSINPRRKINDV